MIGFILHAFYATAIAFALSSLTGVLTTWIAIVSLVLGTVIAINHARMLKAQSPDLRLRLFSPGEAGAIEAFLIVFIIFVSARHFAWLFYPSENRWQTLNPNNFGDLPLHITYIKSMAGDLPFPPVNPNYVREILRYPFGCDLYNALWERVGVPLTAHLFLTGMICAAASLVTLKWFGKWWAIGAFFLSGGIAGWDALIGRAPLGNIHGDPTMWKNFFLAVFVTQRGMMFALPAGLLLLEMTRRHFSGESRLARPTQTVLGFIWAIMPLFHAHTFVAVTLLMGAYAINVRSWRGLKELLLSRMAMIAYIPATYFVLRAADNGKRANVLRIDTWWESEAKDAPWFMWWNFGFWLLLPIAIGVGLWWWGHLAKKESSKAGSGRLEKTSSVALKTNSKFRLALWGELVIALAFFALYFNVMLAPWTWDNVKVLMWPYLLFARLAAVVLEPLMYRGARMVVAVVLFFSGFLAIIYSIHSPSVRGLTLYTVTDLAHTKGAIEGLPPTAVFATSPSHDHPLTFFGRLRAMGHEGHMWSHGIDSSPVRPKLDALMRGDPNWLQLAKDIGVTHIFWGAQERAEFGDESKPFMDVLKNISRVPEARIYDISTFGSVQNNQAPPASEKE